MRLRLFLDEKKGISAFEQRLVAWCQEMGYDSTLLQRGEIAQLRWSQGNPIVTPEVREVSGVGRSGLHFEVERALARFFSLVALRQKDYELFVKAQASPVLPRKTFLDLAKEAQALDLDLFLAIRASCFWVMSPYAKILLADLGHTPPDDSEVFQTLMAKVAATEPQRFPLTANMSWEQLALLEKAFWPDLHFRHMLYMEGSIRMTLPFTEALKRGELDERGLWAWKWRWLTNLFGFKGGPGARYFNEETFEFVNDQIDQLQHLLRYPDDAWMEARLDAVYRDTFKVQERVMPAPEPPLFVSEKRFLALLSLHLHSVPLLHHKDLTTDDTLVRAGYCSALVEGYRRCKERTGKQVAWLSVGFRQDPQALTPTYVPAVLNGVFYLLRKVHQLPMEEAIRETADFSSQFFAKFYLSDFRSRISCRTLSDTGEDGMLVNLLSAWMEDPNQVDFEVDENGNFQGVFCRDLTSQLRMG